eukprot:2852035-Pyramimonas_sp.AAC.1
MLPPPHTSTHLRKRVLKPEGPMRDWRDVMTSYILTLGFAEGGQRAGADAPTRADAEQGRRR